ncbi:MAG TPA: dipeptidase [Bacteroidales bacterium]|nr:dipeptidase [Bacteroidales bacterium]
MRGTSYIFFILLFLVAAGCSDTERRLAKKADKIHETILTVDTHCDTPMNLMRSGFDIGKRQDNTCVDFPRMREGGLDAEFFAVFIGQGPRNDSAYQIAHNKALDIFKAIRDNVNKYSNMAEIALRADDAWRIKKEGRLAIFIGVENGYPAGLDITRIKEFYDLGARYMTLSHSRNNDICDSSTDPAGPEHNGLSSFGEEVVKRMNALGMMVDVSHISDEAFYDVLNISAVPVIASHSSCRALCENPRNLSDDMILALKKNGGVIQICILSAYLKSPEANPALDSAIAGIRRKYGAGSDLSVEQMRQMRDEIRDAQKKYEKLATVKDLVDHIDHVVQVAGIDYVGIGTDFDGGGKIAGCSNVGEMKNITIELLRRGYSRKEIEKIWSGNIMRVMRAAEAYAAGQSQASLLP